MTTHDLTDKLIKDLLLNWSYWARDTPPEPAEGGVCPMFAAILPKGKIPPYDEAEALLVEAVLSIMHIPYHPEWWILCAYYGKGMTHDEIADKLCLARITVTTRRLPMARRIFAEQWVEMLRKISPFENAT